MTQDYVGDKAVTSVIDTEKKTPLGGKMLKVCYENGTYEYMPEKRFLIIKTDKPSDASTVRGMLLAHSTREIGSVVYGMLHEFGVKLSEVEPILNQAVVLANAASEKATNLLWMVDFADERTLNQINDILLEHVANKHNNAGSPVGEGASASNPN